MIFGYRNTTKRALVTLLIFLLSACGGGSDDPATGGNCPDLTGTWLVTESQVSNTCGSSGGSEQSLYTVTQDGCTATITDGSKTLTGTFTSNSFTFTGSYPSDSGGIVTVTGMAVTVSGDLNSMSGTSTWTWEGTDSSCEGIDNISGSKLSSASVDVSGTWTGTWDASAYGISGSFTADVVQQQDSTLTGTIDVPYAGLFDSPLTGVVTGNQMTFGDINDVIVFNGTVSNGTSASGTFDYSGMGVSGTWSGSK